MQKDPLEGIVNPIRLIVALALISLGFSNQLAAAPPTLYPDHLRCELLKNPLGIDILKAAYELGTAITFAGGSKPKTNGLSNHRCLQARLSLKQNLGDLWDSGKIHSDQSIHVPYGGKHLPSHQVCWWKLRVWDEGDRVSAWSSPSFWTMGLLKPEEWKAQWIGYDAGEKPIEFTELSRASWIHHPGSKSAAIASRGQDLFRHQFVIPKDKTIARALCGMAGVDSFNLYVNGQEVNFGFDRRTVEFSQWSKIVDLLAFKENWGQVVEINELQPGTNILAVALRNPKSASQNSAGLIGALRIEFSEGKPMVVSTNSDWKSSDQEADRLAGQNI